MMSHRTRTWAYFALILVVVCLSISVVFAQDATPEAVGLRPDAPAYGLHGPYWVGTQAFKREAGADPVDVRVWYPALNPSAAEEKISYVMHWKIEGLGFTRDQALVNIAGHALLDAKVDLSSAPYPLVVFSHGSNSESVLYAWLIERIASYGFVVIAPDHKEENDPGSTDYPRTALARPVTISGTIDYAAMLTATKGALAGMIDMEKIAVAGHSGGGSTALASAGARMDMVQYAALCAKVTPDSPSAYQVMCTPPADVVVKDMAKILGLDPVPTGLWPPMGDPRIDAAISISGDGFTFNEKGLAELTVPVLTMGGTSDSATPYELGPKLTYQGAASKEKILVSFANGDHYMFSSSCKDAPTTWEVLGNDFYFICSDSVWDVDRVHDLANHFAVAFLLDILKGDKEAAKALAPDAVSFAGITYDSQGF